MQLFFFFLVASTLKIGLFVPEILLACLWAHMSNFLCHSQRLD